MESSAKQSACNEEQCSTKKMCSAAEENVDDPKPKIRSALALTGNVGQPPPKQVFVFGDSTATPNIRKINEVLAVELLEAIIRTVPTERTGRAWTQLDLSKVTITRQFQLRYLCRLWRNIVLKNTKLTVVLERAGGMPFRKTADFSVCPAGFRFATADDLFLALSVSANQNLFADDWKWIDCIAKLRLNWYGNDNHESVISVLSRLTKEIHQSVSLSLNLSWAHTSGFIKHGFRTSFSKRFPNLTLTALNLEDTDIFSDENPNHPALLTKFYLTCAFCSLLEFDVNLFALNEALAVPIRHSTVAVVSDQSVCFDLLKLRLHLNPPDSFEYNFDSAGTRDATYAIEAKLPCWFPRLKELQLDWPSADLNRIHFDFTVLNKFSGLDSVRLLEDYLGEDMPVDCKAEVLPNIRTFSYGAFGPLPLDLTHFVPNVQELFIWSFYWWSCEVLTEKLNDDPTAFQKLSTLKLDFRHDDLDWAPKFQDVKKLLLALRCAANLTSLEIGHTCPRCPSGDLSLLDVIPKTVVNLSLDCCLKPKWYFRPKKASRQEVKAVYQEWIRDLLYRLREFPVLKEFRCVAPAPRFKTVRSLMMEWSLDSVALLVELDIDSITRSVEFDLVEPTKCLGFSLELIPSRLTPISANIAFRNAKKYSYFLPSYDVFS